MAFSTNLVSQTNFGTYRLLRYYSCVIIIVLSCYIRNFYIDVCKMILLSGTEK